MKTLGGQLRVLVEERHSGSTTQTISPMLPHSASPIDGTIRQLFLCGKLPSDEFHTDWG
jgi:hypothetical protein